jgi:hypothetical protein
VAALDWLGLARADPLLLNGQRRDLGHRNRDQRLGFGPQGSNPNSPPERTPATSGMPLASTFQPLYGAIGEKKLTTVISLTRRTRWREGVDDNVLVPPEKLVGAPLALGRAWSSLFALVWGASHYIRVCRTLESGLSPVCGQ